MKGLHHIIVQNGYLKYEFDIRRNITIIQGDSATGKTTMVEMIQEHLLNGEDSGVELNCDCECRVIQGNTWREQLSLIHQSIVFIDEGNRFISSPDFAVDIKNSDNYYVIVTRENLEMLPYSVDEIYGIRSSGKYGGLTKVYHEFYHIYNFENETDEFPLVPQKIIVEDSNSGYDFFNYVCTENNMECISAAGKSQIFDVLNTEKKDREILIIADGAAFGSQMNRIERWIINNKNMHLYLPESFEWLILKSGLLRDSEIEKIMMEPEQFIASEDFFSWEQFFTTLLIQKSKNMYLQYSKRKLNSNYLQQRVKERILETIEGIEFHC